jgi:hypothetical protein
LLLSLRLFSGTAFAQAAEVPVLPGPAPGSEDWNYPETVTLQPSDSARSITNVTRPALTIFLPEASLANGTAIIICPSGGFRWLSFDNEGTILARWLNALGVAAFVLKYRVMRTGDSGERDSAEVALRRSQHFLQSPMGSGVPLHLHPDEGRVRGWGIGHHRTRMALPIAPNHCPRARSKGF